MATTDSKRVYTVNQFLHNMQALPGLSASLLHDARDGESYEVVTIIMVTIFSAAAAVSVPK